MTIPELKSLANIMIAENNLYHRIIKRTPFEAAFGCRPACERMLGDNLSEDVNNLGEDLDDFSEGW